MVGFIRSCWEYQAINITYRPLYEQWCDSCTTSCIPSQHTWPNNPSNAGSGWIQGMDPKELGEPVSEWSATQQYVQTFCFNSQNTSQSPIPNQLNLTWCGLELWTELTFVASPFLSGNDVSLFESQQLDECNNNVQDDDDDLVVLPSAPHSKTSSNSSSPSPSLRSSPSSSPLSPSSTSSTSSSSDAVSFAASSWWLKKCFGETIKPSILFSSGLWWHAV